LLSYRAAARKRMMVIGDFGPMTLDQARARARKMLVEVEDGRDPLDEKQSAALGETFGELIDAYIERHAKVRKKTWEADKRRLDRHIPTTWRNRKADSITRREIADLHQRIGTKTPHEANRLLEILSKTFSLGRRWNFLDETAANPATDIDRFEEVGRDRWLRPSEWPRLAKAIDKQGNIYVRAFLWLLLLTGARKTELLHAKWPRVDWDNGILRLPDTKSGKPQNLTLTGPAQAVLQSIPRQDVKRRAILTPVEG
jgi:integrase